MENAKNTNNIRACTILDLLSFVVFMSQIPINPHQNEHISTSKQVAKNAQVINEDKLQLRYLVWQCQKILHSQENSVLQLLTINSTFYFSATSRPEPKSTDSIYRITPNHVK